MSIHQNYYINILCQIRWNNNFFLLQSMSAGMVNVPIVFRGPNGAAAGVAAQHSQCFGAWYSHCPGLKVAIFLFHIWLLILTFFYTLHNTRSSLPILLRMPKVYLRLPFGILTLSFVWKMKSCTELLLMFLMKFCQRISSCRSARPKSNAQVWQKSICNKVFFVIDFNFN